MAFWKRKSKTKTNQDIEGVADDFVRSVLQGSARCRISTSQLGVFNQHLYSKLIQNGMEEGQIRRSWTSNLTGECPSCGVRLNGEGLLQVGFRQATQDMYAKAASIGGSSETERLVTGACANAKCRSKEVTIAWES